MDATTAGSLGDKLAALDLTDDEAALLAVVLAPAPEPEVEGFGQDPAVSLARTVREGRQGLELRCAEQRGVDPPGRSVDADRRWRPRLRPLSSDQRHARGPFVGRRSHDGLVEPLTREGLGLDYRDLRVASTTEGWLVAGASLRDAVIAALGSDAQAVEQIGSSSVVGLVAKPIIDLAVGVSKANGGDVVRRKLEGAGWIYRGDAGDGGGLVFVLEARPGSGSPTFTSSRIVGGNGSTTCSCETY